MSDAVNTVSAAVTKLGRDWPMIEALTGGTTAMRGAREALLPKWPAEETEAYEARVKVATLFPAFRRTVSVMVGKPFSQPITLGDDVPPQIQAWADDIDTQGINLHAFAAEMLAEALSYGLCGILVEAPKPIAPKGATVTVADEKAAGVRPYFVRVKHDQLLGWRTTVGNGKTSLSMLRIKECATEADGEYGEREVERVRVLRPGSWEVWEKVEATGAATERWDKIDEGQTGLSEIPFVPLYGFRHGFMCGASALLDLAHLNVKHWQSQSDQDTILHVARVPILAIIGGNDKTTLTIGTGSAVNIPTGGDMKFVEHTGAAIDAGQKSLEALEDQMIQAGAELLVKKPGDRSATESANDAEANKSDLQRLVEGFEDGLDQALWFMAQYASLDTGGHVSLYKDFGAANLSDASGQLILLMEQAGMISKETAITEMKRRGELSAEVDPEEEAEKVAQQPPALGMLSVDAGAIAGGGQEPGGAQNADA